MRQIRIGNGWVEGVPTEAGQRYRILSGSVWRYGTYTPDTEQSASDMRITKRAFFDRLLPEEERAIDLASLGDTQNAAEVRRAIRRLEQSPFVDLAFDQTIAFVRTMEAIGLLNYVGRADEILSPPVTELERWK
jgi:hypothetical protein